MNLRLVTTDTGRAIAIRDHILPLLRQDGAVEVQRDVVRLTKLRIRDWVFRLWTPFNELGREEASSPSYRTPSKDSVPGGHCHMGSTSGREQRGSFGSSGPTMGPSMWRALSEDSGRTRSLDCREGMNVRVVLGDKTSCFRVFAVPRPSIGGHADIGIVLDVVIRFVVGFGRVISLVDFLRTDRRRVIIES